VNKTSRVCSKALPSKVFVSKETVHYLELYTNNYWFDRMVVKMKGINEEPIFKLTSIKSGFNRSKRHSSDIK